MNARVSPAPLPYGRPTIEDDDIAAVAAVLRSGWLTTGPMVERFETALAAAVGAPHAVVCNSGTAALHLTALALDLGPKSTVVVPAITFVATANAARYVNANVVFADVDPTTGLMTPATLEAAIARAPGRRIDAAIPVHLNGQTCDMPALKALAATHGFALVEDACHALGTNYQTPDDLCHPVGGCAHSDFAVFSFHPVKTIAMGEGGAITLRDGERAARLRRLRAHGLERDAQHFHARDLAFDAQGQAHPWYYELGELGLNYRASDIQCALGLSQLGKLTRFARARAEIVRAYDRALAPLAPHLRAIARAPANKPAWHLYVVHVDFAGLGTTRSAVMHRLAARGIGSQVHYIPVPLQPYYAARETREPAALYPGALAYYAKALTLPLFVGMSEADVGRVAFALGEALGL